MMKKLFLAIVIGSVMLTSCTKKGEPAPVVEKSKYDLDFTKMNFNMVSSVTFEMLVEPEKYINKSVLVSGDFCTQLHEGNRIFAVLNWDATGCCPAGMDFIPPADKKYPEDFPPEGTKMTVSGKMVVSDSEDGAALLFVADKMEF